jgi:cytochrome P450
LQAWKNLKFAADETKVQRDTIISKLWGHHKTQKNGVLDDLDIASECADHLLAGIDTTADTLMFLIWALSRPQHHQIQRRLQDEILAMPEGDFKEGVPTVEACDKLKYLDAAIKETLRLYAPLPASEPRSYPQNVIVDGYMIDARTVVSMAPFNLHRNPEVFKNPLAFVPERWLGNEREFAEMKKWFWAFSSGGRMCIGMQ